MGNEYLKRQCTTTGDRSVWTWAGWVKNQNHKATSGIFGGYYSNPSCELVYHAANLMPNIGVCVVNNNISSKNNT